MTVARYAVSIRWVPDVLALLVLALLTVLMYRPLIFTNAIAVDPLLMRLVYPYREFLADALRDGRLPLWNPYLFTGVPFLADPQAAVLYPPNFVLRWLDAPRALVFSIVLHSLIAAAGMYTFARFALRVVRPAAFVAAAVFALGGFMASNTVEPNVVEASAWLPLALLAADAAVRRTLAAGILATAVVLALQCLAGQPQVSALTLAALALLLIIRVLTSDPTAGWATRRAIPARLGRAALIALVAPALAAALAAVQLLPTWELVRRSPRAGGLSYAQATAGALAPAEIVRALLPGFTDNPDRLVIGFIGVVALGLVVLGLRRWSAGAALALTLILVGLAAALGDATPIYPAVYRLSHGQAAFDHPTHALLLTAFGGAIAASLGLQALWPSPGASRRVPGRRRWLWPGVLALVGLSLAVIIVPVRGRLDLPGGSVREIWLGLGIVAIDIAVVLPMARPRRWVALVVAAAVAAELLVASARLPFTRTAPAAAFAVAPAMAAAMQPDAPARVAHVEAGPPSAAAQSFDTYAGARAGRDQLAPDTGMLDGINTLDGLRTALLPARDLVRAFAGSALPTSAAGADAGDASAAAASPRQPDPAGGEPGAARSISVAGAVQNLDGALGPRLSASYVLGPPPVVARAGDITVALGPPVDVRSGASVTIDLPAGTATDLVLLTDFTAAVPMGQPVVDLSVTDNGGVALRRVLVAGVDTGGAETAGSTPITLAGAAVTYVSEQPLGRSATYHTLTVRNTAAAELRLRAVALVDERTGAAAQVPLAPGPGPVTGNDATLYADPRALPRASFVRRYLVETDAGVTLDRLGGIAPDETVLDRAPFAVDGGPGGDENAADAARIVQYTPERVEVVVTAGARGVLVLRDSFYPGWQTRVDGEPAPLLRADGLFRAVPVPAGVHAVTFEFRPDSFRRGTLISLGAWALAVTGVAARIARRRWNPAAGHGPRE